MVFDAESLADLTAATPAEEPDSALDARVPITGAAAIGAVAAQQPKPQTDPDKQPVRRRRRTLPPPDLIDPEAQP
jgi:hypothetical protein